MCWAPSFLLRLIWTFNKFDDIWLLTGGGFGTNVLPVLTYQFSFQLEQLWQGGSQRHDPAAHPGRVPGLLRVVVMRDEEDVREDCMSNDKQPVTMTKK